MKKGFTLAEVLITLTILGIVAAITVPSLMRRQVETSNKVKIKKAMATFDDFVQQANVENNLNTLNEFANFKNDNNCEGSRKYFKIVESDETNPCIFKTSDGLWWRLNCTLVPDLAGAYVSFKKDNLSLGNATLRALYQNPDDNTTFAFCVRIDENGAFRVNDLGYLEKTVSPTVSESGAGLASTRKLYSYINNEK